MTASKKNPLGPTGERVQANVARIRDLRGLTYRELSERLEALERAIPVLGLSRIERGERRVDADDLVALAVALGVTPNRLLLPGRTDGGPIALTPATSVEPGNAWRWAEGRFPLVSKDREKELYDPEERADFIRHSNPQDRWHREQHTAMRAAQDVLGRIDDLLRSRENVPDPQSLPTGDFRRAVAEEAPGEVRIALGEVRRALARLVAEIDDLLGPDDASR